MTSTKMVTGKVIFTEVCFPNNPEKEGGLYSVRFLIPKEDRETIEKVYGAMQEAVTQGISTTWNGKEPWDIAYPLETEEDAYTLTAETHLPPVLIDTQLNTLDPVALYPGCKGRVSIFFYASNKDGENMIKTGLNNIQKLEDRTLK